MFREHQPAWASRVTSGVKRRMRARGRGSGLQAWCGNHLTGVCTRVAAATPGPCAVRRGARNALPWL
eukprot:174054-Prymnesium_polylepis.1